MAAAYDSRDIVEEFVRYKLLSSGAAAWRVPPPRRLGQRGRDAAAATSHRGVALQDSQQDPSSAPPRLHVVLQRAGEELERCYRGDLSAQVSVLLCDGDAAARRRGLTAVREELFRDGVNWGRIVAMMQLGGALCTEVAKTGGARQVDDIARWMEESLDSPPLQGWIEDNGGWDAFVELYGASRPAVPPWSLRTVFGLAVLGAAGITLGVLFSQR